MIILNTILQNRYRVIRELGHGGMGTVYEALDQRVNCLVALKETSAGNNAEARRAFQREASLLGNLRHSGLAKVMDYFSEEDRDFLIMEFIPGYDLAELIKLRGTPFPEAQASVFAQGGTGKMPPIQMPPIQRMPPPIQRMPPPRRDQLPERKQVNTDICVVPITASRSRSITDRLPEALGQFRRNNWRPYVSDYTNKEYGAVEVVRADYAKDIFIFLSRFKDAASATIQCRRLRKRSPVLTRR